MVLGSAGIFGGNERSKPISAAKPASVKQGQAKAAVSTFAPVFKAATQAASVAILKPTVAAKVLTGAKNVAVKSSPPAVVVAVAPAIRTTGAVRTAAALTLTNGLPPVGTITTTTPTTSTTGTTPTVKDDTTATVIDTLKAALVQSGIDISGMTFIERRDLVTYPTGSYINDIISLQTSGGQSHEYMTNLVAIAPQVTVNEIQQLLLGNRG